VTIELKSRGIKETIANLEALPKDIDDTMKGVVSRGVDMMLEAVKGQLKNKAVGWRSGSFQSRVYPFINQGGLGGGVGTDFKGARLREYGTAGLPGGVLRPKRAKFLAIPLPAALTASGVARGAPRSFTEAFFKETRSGALLLMGKPLASTKEPIPLFVMKKRVEQKAQRPFAIAEDEVRPKIVALAEKELAKMLEK